MGIMARGQDVLLYRYKLLMLPTFLRFDIVELTVSDIELTKWENQRIADKCQLFENHLQVIKPALDSSNLIFCGDVDEDDPCCFHDHSQVVNYLRNQLLPICKKSRGFELIAYFASDKNAGRYMIASFRQMLQIDCCMNVQIGLFGTNMAKLPIEEISQWLHRKRSASKISSKQVRSLLIYLSQSESTMEMHDHLKKVL